MKSQLISAMTMLPIRCRIDFVMTCRHQSDKCYPIAKGKAGAKKSAARFIKMAAIERLRKCGLNEEYLKSIS